MAARTPAGIEHGGGASELRREEGGDGPRGERLEGRERTAELEQRDDGCEVRGVRVEGGDLRTRTPHER